MENKKLKRTAIFILIPLLMTAAIYVNIKIFPADSIWSWQYWIDLVRK